MSQTVRISTINDVFYEEIKTSFPDQEECIYMVKEALEEGYVAENDMYEVETHWYEIGDGESGTDTFFTDDELIEWYKKGEISEIEKNAEERGHYVEHCGRELQYIAREYIENE